jgi:hypothetical protein
LSLHPLLSLSKKGGDGERREKETREGAKGVQIAAFSEFISQGFTTVHSPVHLNLHTYKEFTEKGRKEDKVHRDTIQLNDLVLARCTVQMHMTTDPNPFNTAAGPL